MPQILIVSCVFPPEPVVSATLSYDIAQRLTELGKGVVVLTPEPSRPLNYDFVAQTPNCRFEHIVLKSFTCPKSSLFGRIRESVSFGKAVARYIYEHSDCIDCIYANTWPLFSQRSIAKAAKKKGIPYLIHEQDIYPESYCYKLPRLIGKFIFKTLIPIDKYVQRNATKIVGISPAMIDYLSKSRKVDRNRYVLVRNWQDDQNFIDENKPNKEKNPECHLMYLGSINPTANIPLILEALSKTSSPMIRLSIIGNGPEKEKCQAMAKNLNIDASFDTVAPEKVAGKQSEADVLILCLKKGVAKTATPSKLTAYMLSGRPIIASVDVDSDCANIISEAKCGIVVEPDNVVKLGEAIHMMTAKSSEELNEMGAFAFSYAIKHLSKDSNLEIITNTILDSLNGL